MLPSHTFSFAVAIRTTFGTSQGPKQPLMVSWMFLRSPRRRHSVLSHSTGTAGLPRSVCPQQQPMQTETWPITRRLVVTGWHIAFIGRETPLANYIPGGVYYPKRISE